MWICPAPVTANPVSTAAEFVFTTMAGTIALFG